MGELTRQKAYFFDLMSNLCTYGVMQLKLYCDVELQKVAPNSDIYGMNDPQGYRMEYKEEK